MENPQKSYVSINFPDAVKIPSKRGKWDIGFLLQLVMSSNSVILSAILTKRSNDAGSLMEVEDAILRNVNLLLDLEKDYGERQNYEELKKIVEKSRCWTDAGYDEINNNKFVLTSKINFITLTKKFARQINNKLRKKNNFGKKKKKKNKTLKNEDDYSINDCQRVVDGYLCPFERPIKLLKAVYRKNDKDNKKEDLPEVLRKYDFKHKCEDCSGCPYYKKYGEPCSVANYVEKTTKFEYELTNQFASGKFDEGYTKRFPISEGINGYLKRKKAMFYLWGHNILTATSHLLIKCIVYNLKRFVKLKGSVC